MQRKSKRRRGAATKRPSHHVTHHTSVPTGRAAYAETRRWLLARHGPVCAYCGLKKPALTLTLDHVTPRRGQTAYDRRDNLVLACKRCNSAKADKPFLAYLLAQKSRALNLLKYGEHLSDGIIEMASHVAGVSVPKGPRRVFFGPDPDDESPYADSPYKE
ncbi:MAG TPA: HNH endonuclease [Gemmatimonadaceae bacterium]|nr:HNH endonuclease [Gemmatimonadaceae bacterium]